jgi:hypothetical protein
MLETLALQPLVASFENYLFREAPEEFPSQADASSWLATADAHIDALRKLAAADEDPECHVPSVVVQSWEFLLPLRQTLLDVEGGADPSQAGGNRMRGPTAAEKRLCDFARLQHELAMAQADKAAMSEEMRLQAEEAQETQRRMVEEHDFLRHEYKEAQAHEKRQLEKAWEKERYEKANVARDTMLQQQEGRETKRKLQEATVKLIRLCPQVGEAAVFHAADGASHTVTVTWVATASAAGQPEIAVRMPNGAVQQTTLSQVSRGDLCLPEYWEPMVPKEVSRVVELDPNSVLSFPPSFA